MIIKQDCDASDLNRGSFEFWGGAEDTWQRIYDADLENDFLAILEDAYPDGIDLTQLNDILRFEPEWCYEMVGLSPEDDEEDEEDEE